jgi:hypothetical protein
MESERNLTLFDRINIASCAMKRAQDSWLDEKRFSGEFKTARMWTKYRCVIHREVQYVESN